MEKDTWKQAVIVRKDLQLTSGKLAGQVAHGSMAFLTNLIRNKDYTDPVTKAMVSKWDDGLSPEDYKEIVGYEFNYIFDKDLYEQWINGIFTKVILQAKNKNQLLKAKTMAEEIGMVEGVDFFLIYDCCLTELTPEEEDGTTLTCIGFAPKPSSVIDQIGKKYHLYT